MKPEALKDKECEMCLHPIHKGECRKIVEYYGKLLQKETGKKRGICGCMG